VSRRPTDTSAAPLIDVPLPGGHVVFSTREGGVSEGPYESLNLGILTDDDDERVTENRARLARSAGLRPEQVAMGWQVHGAEIREWDGAPADGGYARPGADLHKVDGHATDAAGVALLVLVADCLPVGLVSPTRVAMLHCGWRGLASGIIERAVATFEDTPAAAIGPGIGPCHYEVGPEVLAEFADLDGVASGRMLDLKAVAAAKLRGAGVDHVHDVDRCTYCEPDAFFSHRRDRGVTGRQGGMAWRT
jgi:polyphenol oxidase